MFIDCYVAHVVYVHVDTKSESLTRCPPSWRDMPVEPLRKDTDHDSLDEPCGDERNDWTVLTEFLHSDQG